MTDGLELIDPRAYAEHGYPHETWAHLRETSPIHWCEPPGFEPFWAVTRHLDICEISKQPEVFRNELGPVVLTDDQRRAMCERIAAGEPPGLGGMRTLIEMDLRGRRGVILRWGGIDRRVFEKLAGLINDGKLHHHHPRDPEEQDILAGDER